MTYASDGCGFNAIARDHLVLRTLRTLVPPMEPG